MSHVHVDELRALRRRTSIKWTAYGDDVLPLWVAESDFSLATPIRDALHAAVDRSDTGYPGAGTTLADALSGFAGKRWGWEIDPAQVFPIGDIGVGCMEFMRAACAPGSEVVINTPVYAPFYKWVEAAGCRLTYAPLVDGRIDLAALREAFAREPAAYLLCNPHNPVGRVHDADELAAVAALAAEYDVLVIADEIHAPLVLAGAEFTPFLTVDGAADVGVSIVSASKAWNLPGLKCAQLVTASPRMHAAARRMPADLREMSGLFGVLANVAAYAESVDWLDDLVRTLGDRRAQLGELLAERLPYVRWTPPDATYLAWLDCRALGDGDAPRQRYFDAGVALEPGTKYGAEGSGFVRLNFATSADILDQAVDRMATVRP